MALVYNITEVAFKWHFIWVTLLLGRIPVLDRSENGMHTVSAFDGASASEQYAELPLETADLWESSPVWPPERRRRNTAPPASGAHFVPASRVKRSSLPNRVEVRRWRRAGSLQWMRVSIGRIITCPSIRSCALIECVLVRSPIALIWRAGSRPTGVSSRPHAVGSIALRVSIALESNHTWQCGRAAVRVQQR